MAVRTALPILLSALLFISCPEPISQEILNQAEDTNSPRITISEPLDNSIYYSSVDILGIVADDAIASNDNQGVIEAFSYEVLYDPDRRGGIVRGAGGSYVADADAGSGVISYIPSTGAFSFQIDTVSPSVLSGQITLRLSATDSNGNTSIRDLKLLESGGPVITLNEPGGSVLDFTDGTLVPVEGTIENSSKDSGSDEIYSVEWNANNEFFGSLTIDGLDPDGIYTALTSPQGYTFTFDTATGVYESFFSTDDPNRNSYGITVNAEDKNGHRSSANTVIYRQSAGPAFEFSAATNALANSEYLRIGSFSPFPIELVFSDYTQVVTLTYQARSNAGDPSLSTASPGLPLSNIYSFTPNGGGTYAAEISGWQDTTGTLILYVTATNLLGESAVRTKRINLDSIAPTVTIDNVDSAAASLYNGTYYTDQTGSKTIDFTALDNNSGIETVTYSLNGTPITPSASGDGYFTHTLASASDGQLFRFGITVSDKAGNSAADTEDLIVYTANPPVTISSVSVDSGSTAYIIPGDEVTAVFSSSHVIDSGSLPTVSINGFSAAYVSHTATTLTYRIASFPNVGTANSIVDIDLSGLTDAAGRTNSFTDISYAPSLTYDPVEPVITAAKISVSTDPPSATVLRNGDEVTVVWDDAADGNSDIASVDFDFSDFGGGTVTDGSSSGGWTASYVISGTPVNTSDARVAVSAEDEAGNITGPVDDDEAFSIDTEPPEITSGNITVSGASGTGSVFITGDTVTATWNAAADGNDDIASVDFNFSDFGGGTLTDSSSSGGWSRTYTITAGTIDTTSAAVAVSATDDADNSADPVDGATVSVDNQAPTVTGASISVSGASGSGGAFIIGDTVTAVWNASGNSDIASVSFNFSDFGGGTLTDSSSSGGWSRTYTITAGTIDTTGAAAAVTATDDAGNITGPVDDSDSYKVDNQAPTVSSASISVSGAEGNDGTFIAGNTVSAVWDSSGNSDIASVSFNFSDFGGGTLTDSSSSGGWARTYTITAGTIDTTSAAAAATVTDDAGNITGPVDGATASVDNQLPTMSGSRNGTDTSVSLSFSEGVYTNDDKTGSLTVSDFDINFSSTGGSGSATGAYISGVSHSAGDGSATLTITYTDADGDPVTTDSDDSITITPAGASSIYDAAGNAMDAAQSAEISLVGS
jgi:hypothetical protein